MFLQGGTGSKFWDIISDTSAAGTSILIEAERSVIGHALNILRIFGSGAAILMLTIMSIQYFTADGRGMPFATEKKVLIKGEQLKNFAIGAIIFIGASNILFFVEQLVEHILGDMFL